MRAYRHTKRFALHIRKPDSRHGLSGFSMVWVYSYVKYVIYNISAGAIPFYWPLHFIHCSLHIANWISSLKKISMASIQSAAPVRKFPKFIRPQKKFPGAGPRAYRICNTVCIDGGLCRGRSRRGRLGGTGLSLRGGSLQGLLLWWDSSQAGPSKVFSYGGTLHKRVPPRFSPWAKNLI